MTSLRVLLLSRLRTSPGTLGPRPATRPLLAAVAVALATAAAVLVPAVTGAGERGVPAGAAPVVRLDAEPVGGLFDFTPPPVPRKLALTVEDGALGVTWEAVVASDLRDYRVYVDGRLTESVLAGTTSTRLTGLVNDRQYTVTVSARDTRGNESRESGAVKATPRDLTPPPVPTGLAAARGDRSVALAWDPPADTDRTAVQVWRDGRREASLAAGATSYTDTGLTNGRRYVYTLVAVDARGNASEPSAPVAATPNPLDTPGVPTGLRGTAGDASAALTWDASGNPDLTAVQVLQDGRVVATVPAGTTSWTVTGLTIGRAYAFSLVAVDRFDNTSSASAAVEVVPLDLTPPGTPSGVVAEAGDTTADLSWEPLDDADLAGYEVLDDAGDVVARVDAPGRTTHVAGLPNGVPSTFRVVAVDTAGNRSLPSAPVTVTPVDRTPPAVVQGTAVEELDHALGVTWSPVPDAVRYQVLLDGDPVGEVGAAGPLLLLVEDLEPGRERGVVVLAVDAAGNVSAPHAPVLATPGDALPSAPTQVQAVPGDGTVVVSWARAGETDVVEHRVLVDGRLTAVVPVTPDGGTSTVLTGLEPGVEVDLVVVAVDTAGQQSPPSAVVRVALPVPSETPPPYAPLVPPAEGSGTATGAGLAATRDGRWVVVSTAARLEAGDTNAAPELHLLDRTRGTSRRVAPLPASWASSSTDSTNASAVAISEDGRYLALSTTARLVPEDRNSLLDAYRLDLRTGEWALVSAPESGAASSSTAGVLLPTGSSVYARSPGLAMTADGSTVLFLSARPDLVPDDRNGVADVFAKDLTTGQVRRVSTSATGGETPLRATGPALEVTPDGRYAVFPAQASGRPLVLVRKDLVTGELLVASTVPRAGSTPVEVSVFRDTGDVAVSDDGRYVAFSTAAKPAAPTTSWSTGLAYRKDLVTGELEPLGTGQTAAWEHQLGLDPTGRYGFVATAAPLLAEDGNRRTDHYRRDLATGDLRLVTSRADGAVAPSTSGSVTPAEYGRVLVLGADRVLVGTVLPLVDGDANGLLDVYGRDLARGEAGAVVG